MKPIIKWAGGKRRFLPQILEEINNINYNSFHELFAGSAALFFELEKKNSIISDLNEELINFYIQLRDNEDLLFEKINKLLDFKGAKKDYYKIREKYNKFSSEKIDMAAMFFFLNKIGFNGIYRVNLDGKFNVPIGKSKTYFIPTKEEFSHASKLLKETKIIHAGNWDDNLNEVEKKDLIYLDPPYYPDESSKFVGYTDPRFGTQEHLDMIMKIRNIILEKNVTVMISNSASTEFEVKLNELLGEVSNIKKVVIETNRSINPKVKDKTKFIETLYVITKK